MTEVFVARDHSVAIVVTQAIRESLLRYCVDAGQNETGGILIGHYTPLRDQAVITQLTGPPPDSTAGPTWFVRGVTGLQRLINRAWRRRDFYLGEWHFHPFAAAEPSDRDRRQILDFAKNPNYRCPEPVLLVVGGDPSAGGELSMVVVLKGIVEGLRRWEPRSKDPARAISTRRKRRPKGAGRGARKVP